MKVTTDIQKTICSLFEVHEDEGGTQRVVTPMEYAGTGDKIVVRVRPRSFGYQIDENGEAAFYASLAGADLGSEAIVRWRDELQSQPPVTMDEEGTLMASTDRPELIAPYIFRVADAAQQLHTIATARQDRTADNFKEVVAEAVHSIANQMGWKVTDSQSLPIAGDLVADHILDPEGASPTIIISAPNAVRLLEAELIFQTYRQTKLPGKIIALSKSQEAVGKKQYERSAYYLDRSLIFNPHAVPQMLTTLMQ